ncbi:PKD domain-containing protein [Winogradskyella marincola]|uniref:PKD domain-containing protein n=1 Tax=Winogradskyella marincola TaxID=3037795 RepID=A0ABT6FZZ5_9FLAO|nr:PKD domain-containing protein [Winogradskyella sp. YYF002]MDG4715262.1 PKD domain-containing protein [Winogradskyella sp. YYF002]
MTPKKVKFCKLFYFILCLTILNFSCEDDIREVTLYDNGETIANVSNTHLEFGETINFTSSSTKSITTDWTFEGGTPATSINPNVEVTYNSSGTFEAQLLVKYVDNTTETFTFSIFVEEDPDAGPVDVPCGEYGNFDIVLVTDNVGADQGFINLLEGAGHTVQALEGQYNNLNSTGANQLNNFDLVIISRNTNSVQIGGENSALASIWATVETPVLNMNPYTARSSRLQLFNSTEVDEGGGNSLDANLPDHPVFSGITLTDNNTGAILTGSGLQTVIVSDVGNGTLIASDDSKVAIVEWDANVEFYDGAIPAAGKRMFMSSTSGYMLNEVGDAILLNAVQYLVAGAIPEPCNTGGPFDVVLVTDSVADDQGFITILEEAGHTVQAINGQFNNLDAGGANQLNNFDVVIISRNTNSVNIGGDNSALVDVWASVSTPVLNMNAYAARSSRLQLFNSTDIDEGTGNSLDANLPEHPIFTDVELTDGNTGAILFADGFHTVLVSDVGSGTLIASDGTKVAIVEWEANTEAYPGAVPASGKRMFMSSPTGYRLNEIGNTIFINAVEYLGAGN